MKTTYRSNNFQNKTSETKVAQSTRFWRIEPEETSPSVLRRFKRWNKCIEKVIRMKGKKVDMGVEIHRKGENDHDLGGIETVYTKSVAAGFV